MNVKQSTVEKQLDLTVGFLNDHYNLINGHMVDFFINSWFQIGLTETIQTEINNNGYKKTNALILSNETESMPSLNQYILSTKKLTLNNISNLCLPLTVFNQKLEECKSNNSHTMKINRFMKLKKAHEVETLCSVVACVKEISNTSHVVDIGDGKGYLSSLLASQYEIPVLGVDSSVLHTASAINRVNKLQHHWNRFFKLSKDNLEESSRLKQNIKLYKQITQHVTEKTDFIQLVEHIFLEKSFRIGLVGLHTCGNLGAASIKIFANNNNIKSLCNVSCCYHLLNEQFDYEKFNHIDNSFFGFPLSKYLISKEFKIGRAGRMLSSQSVDRILYHRDLPSKTIFYRSILEIVLKKYNGISREKNIGKIRKESATFVDYARFALKRLDLIDKIVVTDEELNEIYEEYKDLRDQLNVFYLLRNMLAPVIESLILLDRYLYLLEQGHENVYLVKLFDSVISPRCYGIIAFKH